MDKSNIFYFNIFYHKSIMGPSIQLLSAASFAYAHQSCSQLVNQTYWWGQFSENTLYGLGICAKGQVFLNYWICIGLDKQIFSA